jgi:hypothetical protein
MVEWRLVIKPLLGTRTNGRPLSPAGKRLGHKPHFPIAGGGGDNMAFPTLVHNTRKRISEQKSVEYPMLCLKLVEKSTGM